MWGLMIYFVNGLRVYTVYMLDMLDQSTEKDNDGFSKTQEDSWI